MQFRRKRQGLEPFLGPPAPRFTVDWAPIEDALGTRLPSDYKAFVDAYGVGVIDEELWIFGPSENPNLDLVTLTKQKHRALRYLRDRGEVVPYDVESAVGGLIPWGSNNNGDTFYWHRVAEEPDAWTVVLNEARAPEWESFDGGMVAFLLELLSHRFDSEILGTEFPLGDPPLFRPAP